MAQQIAGEIEEPLDTAAAVRLPGRGKLVRAALASGTSEILVRGLSVVMSIATARCLEPREVGVLGLAVTIVTLVTLAAHFSENAGVIGKSEPSDHQYALAAAIIRAILSALLLGLLLFSLPLIVRIFSGKDDVSSELAGVIGILLWGLLVETATTYPRVFLHRRLDLTYLIFAYLAQVGSHTALTLFALWKGYGLIGVAWANIGAIALACAIYWGRVLGQAAGVWDGLPSAKIWREMLKGTLGFFAGGFTGFLAGRIDNLLVASAMGATVMSFYSMGWNISRMPPGLVNSVFAFVLYTTVARCQDDHERIGRAVHQSVKYAFLLVTPLCALMYLTADPLVPLVLGAKWLPVVPGLRIMALTVVVLPLIEVCSRVLMATGRAHLGSLVPAASIGVLALVIRPLVIRWGVAGAAVGDMLATFAGVTVVIVVVNRRFRILRWASLAQGLLPLTAAVGGTVLAWVVERAVGPVPDLIRLAVQIAVFVTGFMIILLLAGGRTIFEECLVLLQSAVRRRVPGSGS
jgi:PST family polysaccharide transporter